MNTRAIFLAALLGSACSKPAAPPAPAAPGAPAAPAKQGAIEGTIHFTGKAPPPGVFAAIPPDLTHVCGTLPQPGVVLGRDGGLSEVVAWVSGAQGPLSAAPAPPAIDQRGCAFHPRVVAAAQGAQLQLVNSDPLLHNVRAAAGAPRPFNVAMPITGMKVDMPLAGTPGLTRYICDVHPWMAAFVRTFDHPYFAVSDGEGRFTIRGVPAGAASLRFWHPVLGEQRAEVEIPENGVARPQIDWPAP
jgi:plastocyanin